MGDHPAGHDVGERLYVAGDTLVHRAPAHVKVVAAFLTVLAIVLTPASQVWAFVFYAVILSVVLVVARLPLRVVAPRMAVEIPFVVFALLLPLIGREPDIAVGPFRLSEAGLWAAWSILAKATLGVLVSVILAATTSTRDIVVALQRLHVPDVFVQILAAMLRYIHVVTAEWQRMERARRARGFTTRGPRAWPVLAHGSGTLFIRSYERGERVHLAMISRGYNGQLPQFAGAPRASLRQWAAALVVPLTMAVCALWAGVLVS